MWRMLRISGWTLGFAVLLLLTVPVFAFAPTVVRCTKTAESWLAQAGPFLKPPPDALRAAMLLELKGRHPANPVIKYLILNSGCSGWSPERGHDHVVDELVMVLPLRAWFTTDELLAILMTRVYMGSHDSGEGVYGLEEAARHYYGREIGDLKGAELSCLARKTRSPSRFKCNGK